MRVKAWTTAAVLVLAAVTVAAVAALAASEGAAAPSQTVKVGLVSDTGGFNDRSFNQSALEGLRRAQRLLKVGGRAVQSRSASEYVPNLASLARSGYSPTISVGFLLADATNDVSKSFPRSRFAIIDYSVTVPPFTRNANVQGLTFATNENSYMIGCLAALMAKRAGGNVISAVGGVAIPPVNIFIAGYRAGARRCVRNTVVLIGYSNDFNKQDLCKEVALNQIARGSRVVFQVAGGCGLGALDAARERGRWGIGVDRDQSALGRHILTSAVKRVDQAVFLTALAVKNGTFRGGRDRVFNLKNAGVGVGKISPRVPKRFIRQMNNLRPLIIRGKIKPPKTL